jgi:hypothetical protein
VDQPSKLGPGLRGLSAVDDRHAWAIRLATRGVRCSPFNCNLEVVATSDGERWESVAMLPAFSDQLDFIDQRTGWAATYTAKNEPGQPDDTATVVATHDGGRTWTPQLSIDGPSPSMQIDFTDQHSGWALVATNDCVGTACTSYSLYQTIDGGGSWVKLQDGSPTSWWSPRNRVSLLGGPHFASASMGWIPILYDGSGTDGVLLTTDGGRTWARERRTTARRRCARPRPTRTGPTLRGRGCPRLRWSWPGRCGATNSPSRCEPARSRTRARRLAVSRSVTTRLRRACSLTGAFSLHSPSCAPELLRTRVAPFWRARTSYICVI